MNDIGINVTLILGVSLAILIVAAFIQNALRKRKGEYTETIGPSKSITKPVTEKKVKAWPIFDNIKTYLIHRTAFFKNRKDRAESASHIKDYKKRSKVYRQLARERFRYSWSGTYYAKKLKPTT